MKNTEAPTARRNARAMATASASFRVSSRRLNERARARTNAASLLPLLLMLAIVGIWGWTFALMKEPIAEYGVVPFLAVRFMIGSLALGSFAGCRRGMTRHAPLDRKDLRTGLLIGLLLSVCYLLQTFGLRYTTASNTGLITGFFIFFAPLFDRLLFGTRTPATLWGAIGISLAGLVLLSGSGGAAFTLGDLLTLAAAVCYGLHVALVGWYSKKHDALVLTWGQLLSAAVVFSLLSLLADRPTLPSASVWIALLVTGLLATAAAFLVQTWVQRRLTVVQTSTIIVLEPVFAVACGYWMLGETLTGPQMAGAALMVLAMSAVEVYPLLTARWRTG